MTDPVTTPPVKWVGGKRRLLPELTRALPRDVSKRRYVEMFAGGAALFFKLQPKTATLCDINAELINFYICLRDCPSTLNWALRVVGKQSYEAVRLKFNQSKRSTGKAAGVEQAARFLYLNKMGFNGLYRENLSGEFNVPRGSAKTFDFDQGKLEDASRALRNVELNTGSVFSRRVFDTKPHPGKGRLIYADPPYDSLKSKGFTGYNAEGFGRAEQHDLMVLLSEAANTGDKIIVSNADTGFIRNTYKNFYVTEVFGSRSVSSDGNGRGKVLELLITSYKPGT